MDIKLIVALDFRSQKDAFALIEHLNPEHCALKVGSEMFTLFGPKFVQSLVASGFKVFLDLKFHDIPNTVYSACRAACDLGVWMVNVHACGGIEMLQAARRAVTGYEKERPLLIAVTILTSMTDAELPALGWVSPIEEQVVRLAKLAKFAHLDGVVSSAWEASNIKSACGKDFLTVTPGIRPSSEKHDDQSRIIRPADAIKNGSDFLVVGRPITRSDKPEEVVDSLLKDIKLASTDPRV